MKRMIAAGLCAAGLCGLGLAGCAGGPGHPKDPKNVLASTGPSAEVKVNGAVGEALMIAWKNSGNDWGKAVFLGAVGARDSSHTTMFDLDQGWVYLNGKFPMSTMTRWPIVTSHTIKIGATGTKFVVSSQGTSSPGCTQRVVCFEGSLIVYDGVSQDETVSAGNYVELTSGVTGGFAVARKGTFPTDPTDPIAIFIKSVLDTVHAEPFKADLP